jgi:hypothetical protein
VYKQTLINAKLKTGKGGKKKDRGGWEKYIKEANVRIGLYCHLIIGKR